MLFRYNLALQQKEINRIAQAHFVGTIRCKSGLMQAQHQGRGRSNLVSGQRSHSVQKVNYLCYDATNLCQSLGAVTAEERGLTTERRTVSGSQCILRRRGLGGAHASCSAGRLFPAYRSPIDTGQTVNEVYYVSMNRTCKIM
jgi:hypothetical protein